MAQGYRVLRFWNDEIFKKRDEVLTVICEACQGHPTPLPSREGLVTK